MKDTITNLLKVKSIITLVLLGLLVYAVVHGIIEGKFLETVITMVFSFYFGTQYQKGVQQQKEEDDERQQVSDVHADLSEQTPSEES